MTQESDYFRSLPKIDLHIHIDGALRTETILELAREQGHALPADNKHDLAAFTRVSPDCRTLTEFLKVFEVYVDLLREPEPLERVTRELCLDLAADGVVYAEPRFAPVLNIKNRARGPGRETRATMGASIKGAARGLREGLHATGGSLQAGLILCCYRGLDPGFAEQTVELAAEINAELACDFEFGPIVGVDLAGDESRYPGRDFASAFRLARELGFPITVHAGEAAGPSSVREALEVLGADRIGHGIRAGEDPKLLDDLARANIPLEICLSSNTRTGAVSDLENHPLPDYLRRGVRVTLNSDDPAVLDRRLSDEWRLARATFGLNEPTIQGILQNAARVAFAPVAVRDSLTRRIDKYFQE